MTKVVISSSKAKSKRGAAPASVSEKRIRGADGRMTTLRTIDLDSSTFGEDQRYVFEKNVAKARRENKRVTGKNDVGPKR